VRVGYLIATWLMRGKLDSLMVAQHALRTEFADLKWYVLQGFAGVTVAILAMVWILYRHLVPKVPPQPVQDRSGWKRFDESEIAG